MILINEGYFSVHVEVIDMATASEMVEALTTALASNVGVVEVQVDGQRELRKAGKIRAGQTVQTGTTRITILPPP